MAHATAKQKARSRTQSILANLPVCGHEVRATWADRDSCFAAVLMAVPVSCSAGRPATGSPMASAGPSGGERPVEEEGRRGIPLPDSPETTFEADADQLSARSGQMSFVHVDELALFGE
jgi:hypothetical protein